MKFFSIQSVLSLFALFVVLSSCDKKQESVTKPQVTIVSPKGAVSADGTVAIEISFSDDNGLQEAEVRLGNLSTPGDVYHTLQKGLNGTSDNLKYTATIPQGVNVVGTNYIYVKCIDVDGNETVKDEDFEIEDQTPPTVTIVNFDDNSVQNGGQVHVYYSFQDEGGVEFSGVELWTSDASGNSTQLVNDNYKQNYIPSQTSGQGGTSISHNWSPGWYKLLVKARDESGNVGEEFRTFQVL